MGQCDDIPMETLVEEAALLRSEVEDTRTVAGLLDIEGEPHSHGGSGAGGGALGGDPVFRTLALLTVILWSLYPVVWVLGTEGVGAVGLSVEVFLFLVLDLLAKVGFGFLLLTNRQALSNVAGGAAGAQPSRVV